MFGTANSPAKEEDSALETTASATDSGKGSSTRTSADSSNGSDRRSTGRTSPSDKRNPDEGGTSSEKKRRSSGVSKARDMLSSAKQSLHLHSSSPTSTGSPEKMTQTPIQKLSKSDPALSVPQGPLNNSAGESVPGPRSTFRVGVTEDKNKKCRRTMEDTHAYLYNFLSTPSPAVGLDIGANNSNTSAASSATDNQQVVETDNGYFAIFDGHAGTFAADWCGKKLHILLEETIRRNPNTPIPELLDQTFTMVDQQLEKLPLKNSGCTAVIAVLRWEDRIPSSQSATSTAFINAEVAKAASEAKSNSAAQADASAIQNSTQDTVASQPHPAQTAEARLRQNAVRQRVLYTANVGDARIVLCRNGKALRLSYDHKGSDENEGRRVTNAGGLILNNRVNGVLAVTRALGDAYMKDLVTGHPYTTETVIQPDQDEFLILACDGLWDVCSDQEAVDLVRHIQDPQAASKQLVDHALARFSTDNLSCMIVRFDNHALKQRAAEPPMGVEGDQNDVRGGISEADAIVSKARQKLGESGDLEEKPVSQMILEEDEQEPGPELNAEALKSAQKTRTAS